MTFHEQLTKYLNNFCNRPSNDIPFSRSFKALHFSTAVLLVSFRFKGAVVFR